MMSATTRPGARTRFEMPAQARLASLVLRVRDLDAVAGFYVDVLGLQTADRGPTRVELRPEGRAVALELLHDAHAPVRPQPSVGLYHFALLLPDRPALAATVRRLMEAKWPFEGASDHGVSEAFYLRDPEGNGIELYRDRPSDTWQHRGTQVEMYSRPLDISALLEESPASAPVHAATRLGHVHLHVDDLEAGERFYAAVLGLNVTQRSYPGALFLAAGGYHHHVGLNTWARGRRASHEATGLVRYTWVVPAGTVEALGEHVRAEGIGHDGAGSVLTLSDPIGVQVEVRDA